MTKKKAVKTVYKKASSGDGRLTPEFAVRAKTLHKYRSPEDMARPGNSNAARFPRLFATRAGTSARNRRVSRLMARFFDEVPWLMPTDVPSVKNYCELEVLSSEIFACLPLDLELAKDSGIRDLLTEFRRLKAQQQSVANSLGLSARSRMEMGLTAAQASAHDLAAQLAHERASPGLSVSDDTVETDASFTEIEG